GADKRAGALHLDDCIDEFFWRPVVRKNSVRATIPFDAKVLCDPCPCFSAISSASLWTCWLSCASAYEHRRHSLPRICFCVNSSGFMLIGRKSPIERRILFVSHWLNSHDSSNGARL